MRRFLPRTAVAAVVALSLALSAGCSDDGPKPVDAVRAAADETVAAGTAQVSISVTTDVTGSATTLTGDGGFDLAAGKGNLSLSLGSLLAGTKVDARIVGDTAYVVPPAFLAALVRKGFLKVDLAQLVVDSPQLGPMSSTADPVTSVDALRGATDAAEVGPDTVRGEKTTHYRGTLDLAAARAEVDADAGAAASLQRLGTLLGTERPPYDVWLDTAGRVRRVTLSVTATVDGKASTTAVTTELFEFGATVAVVEPAAADTADGNAILRTLGGGGAG